MGQQLAGGTSRWCPKLEPRTTEAGRHNASPGHRQQAQSQQARPRQIAAGCIAMMQQRLRGRGPELSADVAKVEDGRLPGLHRIIAEAKHVHEALARSGVAAQAAPARHRRQVGTAVSRGADSLWRAGGRAQPGGSSNSAAKYRRVHRSAAKRRTHTRRKLQRRECSLLVTVVQHPNLIVDHRIVRADRFGQVEVLGRVLQLVRPAALHACQTTRRHP